MENHPVFREALRVVIESESDMVLVSQAASAPQAIEEFRRHLPDITLMDLHLPGTDGIGAVIAIRREFSYARIIILTMGNGEEDRQRAMRAGAAAFVLKTLPKDELLGLIRSVHGGE